MKNSFFTLLLKRNRTLFWLVIIVAASHSCKKDGEDETPPDYRNAYVGTYACFKLCTFWSISQPQTDTTFIGTINLTISKDNSSSDRIVVGQDTIPIDSAGTFIGYYNPPAYKNYSISLRTDSVFLNTFSGGLGGGTSCSTTGVRN